MKQLYFIDNEDSGEALQKLVFDVDYHLRKAGIEEEQILSLKTIDGFWRKDANTAFKIVFNPNNVIVTLSSYAIQPGLWDSRHQLLSTLATAGTSEIKNITYIDLSGMWEKQIPQVLQYDGLKRLWQILLAIGKNNIITRRDEKFYKIIVDFSCDGFFYQPVNLIDYV